ncbi:pectinesterase family protein [uncultured Formosa sp.]|uniref:pectinesterase family protein n=1 Tax=uncultured Formosa sp. TaxID=255435 RepID=UPI0026253234|nr:pectinesterase family protein [uncultured Formosa sp.]
MPFLILEKKTIILIKNVIYKEKLVLTSSKVNVTFIGKNKEKTILTYDDFAEIHNSFGEEIGTSGSTSFFIFGWSIVCFENCEIFLQTSK